MSPNKSVFTSFTYINSGKVLTGNNTTCKVFGIGSNKIKIFDSTMKELQEFRCA